MTERKEDYYQPWLRDAASTDASSATAPHDVGADGGLAKPRELPPVGLDVSSYASEERVPGKPMVDSDRLKAGASGLWRSIRNGSSAFADWTIRIGESADIPARVEAMEIPRRSRELATKTARTTTRAAKAVGRGTARGSAAAAAASAEAWDKMALGEKVGKLSSEAQRGLGDVAGKASEALGQAARAGKESLGEAATKLRPAPPIEAEPPPSGLEQLLAREEAEAAEFAITQLEAVPATNAPDLPLFASEASPVLVPVAAKPAKAAKAAAAAAAPSVSAPAPDDRTPPPVPPRGGSGSPGRGGCNRSLVTA